MANLVSKALQQIVKASRGSLSSYVINAPHQYGQPIPQQLDAVTANVVTPLRMREIVLRTPTAAAAMNAVLDYATNVEITVRNVDPKKKADDTRTQYITELLRRPNPNDSGRRFRTMLMRDMFTLGFAGVELEPGKVTGRPTNLWVLDAGRLFVDYDEHGTILGYDMLNARGWPIKGPDGVHAWNPEQVIWLSLNPQSNSIYPSSRIQQLFASAVIEDMMMAFIGGKFTDSNIPFGVMGIGDITPDELKTAINIWNAQARSQHRIMLTGSKGNLQWVPFGYHLKDLEARHLLDAVRGQIMGIVGVTANELGESQDVNKSNGYNLSYTFKKRAIEPLLQEFCETLTNRLLWDTLGWKDLELSYAEIDSRDELLQSQIDDLCIRNGTWSINHVRNRKGLPDEKGGDKALVFTGSAYIPVDMIEDFAKAQLAAVEAAVQNAQQMTSMPGEQMGQPPEGFHTPDAAGSEGVRFKLPKPKPGAAPPGNNQGAPQSRSAVKTARSVGIRKEDSSE
jgi:hypothetical protein